MCTTILTDMEDDMSRKILIAAAVSMFAAPTFAATQGEITINAKVPEDCEIMVQTAEVANGIMNLAAGAENLCVGEVCERCNDGYTVTVVSMNNGPDSDQVSGLFRDSVSGDELPYTICYDGAEIASHTVTDATEATLDFVRKEVAISYPAKPELKASDGFTYSDTLCFTISAK